MPLISENLAADLSADALCIINIGKVSIELPRSTSLLYVSIELSRSNSFVDTTNQSEFKQPKSVHKTAKVRSFCGFGLLGLKSVHKTA